MPDPNLIAPEALPVQPAPQGPQPKKSHRAEVIMISAAALILIIGGLILYFFAGRR